MTKFNPLDYPIALSEPDRLALSGWLMHVPFAMYLIEATQPRVLVELGTHHGVSYCAFCQAIKTLGTATKAYAVDTWEGDDQAGFYGENVLADLRQHHDPRYGTFSELMQMTFAEAADHFADGTVDLLHIDGLHTYEAVLQDWTQWRPKLSQRGVVLFHDTHVHSETFEVWQLWQELQSQYPSFDITYGNGLGVLAVGPDIPAPLRQLLELPEAEKQLVHEYFKQLGQRVAAAEELLARSKYGQAGLDGMPTSPSLDSDTNEQYKRIYRHLTKQVNELARDNRELNVLTEHQQFYIHQRDLERLSLQEFIKGLEYQFAVAENYAHSLEHEFASLHYQLNAVNDQVTLVKAEIVAHQNQIAAIYNSPDWSRLQRLYRWRQRIIPAGSLRERLYHLSKASLVLMLKGGPLAFTKRVYRWLFKRERLSQTTPAPVAAEVIPPAEPISDPVPTVPDVMPVAPDPMPEAPAVPLGELPPLTAPVYMNVVFPSAEAPDSLHQQLEQAIAKFMTVNTPSLSILNWTPQTDLAKFLPLHAVFPPPNFSEVLPYLDQTVDVVIIRRQDQSRVAEARRVAHYGIVFLEEGDQVSSEVVQAVASSEVELPSLSFILPIFNHLDYTEQCLQQMLDTLPTEIDAEIIVMDDASTDAGVYEALQQWPQRDARIRVYRNDQNRGYLKSCNDGAALATKDLLVMLNNDTLPQPGWIQALGRTFIDFPDAGVVGGMLIYPDGRLQEAGGAVFNLGNAWNVGRLEDPNRAEYNFVRPVDYVSGALLATPRHLWQQIGGFDERFRPAYYEDTDYCFAVRAAGYQVYFQPECRIIHFEGVSSGTDPNEPNSVKHHQAINHTKFVEKWGDALKNQPPTPPDLSLNAVLQTILAGPHTDTRRVLMCGPQMPEFDREAGSRRFADFIEMFQELGWSVSLLIQIPEEGERYAHLLRQRGIAVFAGDLYYEDPSPLLEGGQFDLVLGIFWEMGEHLLNFTEKLAPAPKLVVDTVDLHFVRNVRAAFAEDGQGDEVGLKWSQGENIVRELNVYGKSDAALTVSENEAATLNNLFIQRPNAFYVPQEGSLAVSPVPYEQRRGILFVGNFRHPPNVQAFDYLMEEILPLLDLKVLQDHPLYVVGNDLPKFVGRSAHVKLPHVRMVGWVPSVIPYMEQSRITIVPLLVGAGTKRKLLESLMIGTPSVSTRIGVEGMNLEHGKHILVADDPATFAESITRLLYDEPLWHTLATNGRDLIREQNSHEVAMTKLATVLNFLGL